MLVLNPINTTGAGKFPFRHRVRHYPVSYSFIRKMDHLFLRFMVVNISKPHFG